MTIINLRSDFNHRLPHVQKEGHGPPGLWMADDIRYYNGTETPATDDDAFLIQGYPVTDLKLITRSRRQQY